MIVEIIKTNRKTFFSENKSEGFIDGDLIESFLDLDRASMSKVVAGLQKLDPYGGDLVAVSVEDTIKIVQDLTRIH